MSEPHWIIVGDGSPYTYVGTTTLTRDELWGVMMKREVLVLKQARQVQTIVIPQGNIIGQEHLVGPVSLCASKADEFMVLPTKLVIPDEATLDVIRLKIKAAEAEDVKARARAAGLETDVGSVNEDGVRGRR